jgi:16S rRNA (cytidine1402-2'-O)-methyltransferase
MSESGRLYVCATPIGNLGDVSERLREALGEADVIYAEDTRRTAKLLSHLGISAKTRSLFAGNEAARSIELAEAVAAGRVVALVSDAGMPGISDPGAAAVRAVREGGHEVIGIPGPSAVTTAIAVSGFGGDRFCFEGFLPRKGKERRERIAALAREDRPVVLFASPNRLAADLADLASSIEGERAIVVARELTKLHEEVWSGSLAGAIDHWGESPPKGEVTVVIGPGEKPAGDLAGAVALARTMVDAGAAPSTAARDAAAEMGVPRRPIYQALLDQD